MPNTLCSYQYNGEPIPPGPSILETAEFYGITQKELSVRTGFSVDQVENVLQGKLPVTEDFALALERVLGVSAKCLITFEKNYQQQKASQASKEKIKFGKHILNAPAVQELKKRKIITQKTDDATIDAVLRFYKISEIRLLHEIQYNQKRTALRHKRNGRSDRLSLITWLRICEDKAEKIKCSDYDKKTFHKALKTVRELTVEKPKIFCKELVRICADAGVAVVWVPEFPNVHVKGATRWLTVNKAMIAMNLYENSNDVFWFTFFHEAAHLLLDKEKQFLANYSETTTSCRCIDSSEEEKANKFAECLLIPKQCESQLKKLTDRQDIIDFAAKIGISPGIVVGRLQYDKTINPEDHNDLKRTFEWQD